MMASAPEADPESQIDTFEDEDVGARMPGRSRWRHLLAFPAFVCGIFLLAALAVLLTGNGILVRETIWEGKISCRYLTLRGIVTKEFGYGHVNFGRDGCDFITDPSKPS